MMAVFAMLVFRGNGGVAQSSGVFLAGLLPSLPASFLAGWLCDRFDRKRLMIASQLLAGLAVSGLIFVERIEWIYLLLALEAVFVAIMGPARQAVIPDIVVPEEISPANALLQQLASLIKIAAPVLAGLVLTILSPHQAILLDVLSFVLAAVALSRLPALPPHRQDHPVEAGPSVPESTSTSPWSVFKENPRLRLVFLSVFFSIFSIIGFDVLASVYTRDILHGNEQFFGLEIGLIGVGTLLVTVLLIMRPPAQGDEKPRVWRDMVMGMLLLAVIPMCMAAAAFMPTSGFARVLVLAGCLIGGAGNGLVNVQVSTLLQLLTPAPVLGQISGAFQGTAVAAQLAGILLTPLLVPLIFPMGPYFAISSLAMLLLSAVVGLQLTKPAVPVAAAEQ